MTFKTVPEPRHDDHARGPAGAAITIIQYGDYACGHTRASHSIVQRLLAENPDARLVFRHFPLSHLHPDAEELARVTEAAAGLDRFWPVHDALMSQRAAPDETTIQQAVQEARIDLKQLVSRMDDEALLRRVQRDVAEGREAGVHSTPTFFFNGTLHDGKYDYETLRQKLAQARGPKQSDR
ncbi:MAG TPA: thioredoxin domain-containing protein [Polyangiaceae bacterium]|nr:thioredoxin domain-containing protein [Polyangiaceae bacterium]